MNAAETIAAAIQKLEALKADATPGVWEFDPEPFGAIFTQQEPGLEVETEVAEQMLDADGRLIVTLHRTIDAQLAILRTAGREFERRAENGDARVFPYDYHLDLARSILGES
ncbi:hypothetical protein P5G50_18520 [Leifsonia sp. F6_8S_P_1B]|uniref:Uncharacterized protein n=1 Tax=Leifsonia williamsii TaxID=3035919 RepID=A0ABT8KHG7_9MICO|nr:hypothetical protein [Leifsonia williamsii]MDN4616447.1 hypothetical protein [Leifsonia williamsii]